MSRRPIQSVKQHATPSRTNIFARQRERAESVLEFLQVRRERADEAKQKALKAYRETRLARRQARGYDLADGPVRTVTWIHEHNDRPMRPYVNPERDRSLRGKARVRARRAAQRAGRVPSR